VLVVRLVLALALLMVLLLLTTLSPLPLMITVVATMVKTLVVSMLFPRGLGDVGTQVEHCVALCCHHTQRLCELLATAKHDIVAILILVAKGQCFSRK